MPKDFEQGKPYWDEYLRCQKELSAIENEKPYTKRQVQGDASETGLIKFAQPLLMGGSYGCYGVGGLNGIRETYPYARGVDEVDAMIPFASDIKFNLIIRDMKKEK